MTDSLEAVIQTADPIEAPALIEAAAPVTAAERIQSIDVLRGFALLGILVMNIQAFSMPMAAYTNPTAYGDLGGINLWVWRFGHLFADMKFMSIFSMLFGAGIILMTSRNEDKGRPSGSIHYKRMFLLMIFGMIHAYAFWWGDILFLYAVCGFWLYWLRRLWPALQFSVGVLIIPIVTIIMLLSWWFFGTVESDINRLEKQATESALVVQAEADHENFADADKEVILEEAGPTMEEQTAPPVDGELSEGEVPDDGVNESPESQKDEQAGDSTHGQTGRLGMSLAELQEIWDGLDVSWAPDDKTKSEEIQALTGSYWEELKYRVPKAIGIQVFTVIFFMWRVAGMMLMGMALYRWGVLSAKKSAVFYAGMFGLGMIIGLPLIGWGIALNEAAGFPLVDGMFLHSSLNYYGSVFVAFGWIGLVMLICKTGVLRGFTRRLAAVGQMALTNYFMHTIICTTIFYGRSGLGFGYFGEFERWQQVLVVLSVWVFQLIVSPIWLRHFRFGPFEWLWRSLTYFKPQPMRRVTAE